KRGEGEGPDGASRDDASDRAETIDELEAAGIDLDPTPPGQHRHGDEVHAHDHPHPHARSEADEPPLTGIIGAGAVGTALGVALHRGGWKVRAVASRDPARRERFTRLVEGSRAFAEATALMDEVELIIVAVPDDAVG